VDDSPQSKIIFSGVIGSKSGNDQFMVIKNRLHKLSIFQKLKTLVSGMGKDVIGKKKCVLRLLEKILKKNSLKPFVIYTY